MRKWSDFALAGQDTAEAAAGLLEAVSEAEAIVIGAGSGLSTAAGFVYTGARLNRYFGDFVSKYRFDNMYSAGFYPFETPEEHWAYWSRYIYINRYMDPESSVYRDLFHLVADRSYFVITTNVDHCFQKAGFDKNRLFYTQGDYGLFQCSVPCHDQTYDNEKTVREMVLSQGFTIDKHTGALGVKQDADARTDFSVIRMRVPSELVPHCPVCGKPMSMNLRADSTFVEDEGWHAASARYTSFLETALEEKQKVLFLELGVGANTPAIIKYPFWRMTMENENARYACINFGEAFCPREIEERAVLIDGDIAEILSTP